LVTPALKLKRLANASSRDHFAATPQASFAVLSLCECERSCMARKNAAKENEWSEKKDVESGFFLFSAANGGKGFRV
jgi:hypothetical protein